MTETTPPEFNEIPEPTEPTGAPIPEPVPSPILEFVTAMTEVDPATAFSTSPTMEQEVAAAMTLMPETTAVGLASEPEVDFPESVIAPTLPQALQQIGKLERLLAEAEAFLANLTTPGDDEEACAPTTLPTVQVLLHGANTNHFLTVLNVEPDGAGYLVHVRHANQ